MERQAHLFAGAFLVPEGPLSRSLYSPTLNAFRYLKQHWLVSISALIHRSEDVGLIDAEQARRLWIALSRRGWRREEPLDDSIPIEEPRLLRTAFELMTQRAPEMRTAIGAQLGLDDDDIEELSALPAGFLSDTPPPIELVDFGRVVDRRPTSGSFEGTILTLNGVSESPSDQ